MKWLPKVEFTDEETSHYAIDSNVIRLANAKLPIHSLFHEFVHFLIYFFAFGNHELNKIHDKIAFLFGMRKLRRLTRKRIRLGLLFIDFYGELRNRKRGKHLTKEEMEMCYSLARFRIYGVF